VHPRPEIARRLFEYGARTATSTGLPVVSVVLWLERGGMPPDVALRDPRRPGRARDVDVLRRRALQAGCRVTYRPGPRRAAATGAVHPHGADLAVIEHAGKLVKDRAQAAELGELETLLAMFGARTFGSDVMRAMLGRLAVSREILETSPLYQEWAQEWLTRGREEGREEALRRAVLVVLRGRFPEVPAALVGAIETAPRETVEDMLAHAATETLEQLAARLGVNLT
jgi:hypothetical protein